MTFQEERRNTFHTLDHVYANAFRIPDFDFRKDRYVIFSDLHRCDKKGNDDFKVNEMIYCYALAMYYQKGYTLVLNGDIEEGMEADYPAITREYQDTAYAMERRFVDEHRYLRILGNHDLEWSDPAAVAQFLSPYLGAIQVHEAVLLGDQIFMLHGHQGAPPESPFERFIVRYVWRYLQRWGLTKPLLPILQKYQLVYDRAATNNVIRGNRDKLLYEWANQKKLLLIAGHTHRTMFKSFSRIGQIRDKIERITNMEDSLTLQFLKPALLEKLTSILSESREELARDKSANRLGPAPVPCYFNSGCCVYKDGITGIELDRGSIRLIKWEISETTCECKELLKRNSDLFITIERKIYHSDDLGNILNAIRRPGDEQGA
ncbi:MAG: metallophosphoesterase [Candidatus Zhuqueibacterota bacterium]